MFIVFFLVAFLVSGVVGYVSWFFGGERTLTGFLRANCCGFTFVVCGVLLYLYWFEGLVLF